MNFQIFSESLGNQPRFSAENCLTGPHKDHCVPRPQYESITRIVASDRTTTQGAYPRSGPVQVQFAARGPPRDRPSATRRYAVEL